ncbi:DUF2254 domain-containing protein [Thiococcus pfennigii]|uniref:DUF2254 domain-containing protein n=1 Tax=Thiococcus pfennigii TaxID=1057 RepID=UPI0019040FF5|nr:DUF2254 domain-containing protein [Thiococcus pfennigii]MBK1732164.1 hypothetical protein [Thiococcus pfennigii]
MSAIISVDRLRLFINRLRERLWVKPLAICLLSIVNVFVAKLVDEPDLARFVPAISAESLDSLLSIMASSMLVIATFAVGSMVSAYASASKTATPRAFRLVIADDVSQNALSTFVGAFIFSVVALTAVKNDYFEPAGLFAIFVLMAAVFSIVILVFLRWVDRIARLGRLGTTIDVVEKATADALKRRREAPSLHGVAKRYQDVYGQPVLATRVGYVQHVDIATLHACAEKAQGHIVVTALPGTFATPGRALAFVSDSPGGQPAIDREQVIESFLIGDDRTFQDDPRFGLVVLSEIAGRALSPAVNDPGTAIEVIGALVRLFVLWNDSGAKKEDEASKYDRVEVPELALKDLFDDAFTAIARDGASAVEVAVRLQKALLSLAMIGDAAMREAAGHHGRLALARAEKALDLAEDVVAVRAVAALVQSAAAEEPDQDAVRRLV